MEFFLCMMCSIKYVYLHFRSKNSYSQPRISRTSWAAKKKRSTYPNFDLSDIEIRGINTIGTIENSLTYPGSTYPRLTVQLCDSVRDTVLSL